MNELDARFSFDLLTVYRCVGKPAIKPINNSRSVLTSSLSLASMTLASSTLVSGTWNSFLPFFQALLSLFIINSLVKIKVRNPFSHMQVSPISTILTCYGVVLSAFSSMAHTQVVPLVTWIQRGQALPGFVGFNYL